MKKSVVLWAPFRGAVGTRQAVIATANVLSKNERVIIFQLVDEWEPYRVEFDSKVEFETIFKHKFFRHIGRSNTFHRRDFFLLSIVAIPLLAFQLRRYKADKLIAMLLVAPIILASTKLTKTSLYISVQGSPAFLLDSYKSRNIYFRLENLVREKLWYFLYRKAECVFCMSDITTDKIKQRFHQKFSNVVTLRNPLFSATQQVVEKKPCFGSNFIFVGRDSHQKNFSLALEFFASIDSEYKSLTVYGDFNGMTVNDSRIRFAGYTENLWQEEDVKGSIHLVTSRWEDPGHAILEGLAAQVPTLIIGNSSDFHFIYASYQVPIYGCSADAAKFLVECNEVYTDSYLRQVSEMVASDYSIESYSKNLRDLLCLA